MEWLNNWINRQDQKRFEQAVSIQAARETPGKVGIGNWKLPDYGISELLFGGPSGGRNDYQYLQNRNRITQNAKENGSVLNVPVPSAGDYTTAADTRNQDIAGEAEDAGRSIEDMEKIHSDEGLETVIGGEDDTPVSPPNLEKAEQAVDLAKARKDWLDKTANSPAAKAGFDDDTRWNLHLKNQQWRKDKGRKYTHGDFLEQPTISEKVDDFVNNENEEKTNNEEINNEQTNNEQTNPEDKSVSDKVDDLVEDITKKKDQQPTNPVEMMGF